MRRGVIWRNETVQNRVDEIEKCDVIFRNTTELKKKATTRSDCRLLNVTIVRKRRKCFCVTQSSLSANQLFEVTSRKKNVLKNVWAPHFLCIHIFLTYFHTQHETNIMCSNIIHKIHQNILVRETSNPQNNVHIYKISTEKTLQHWTVIVRCIYNSLPFLIPND